MKFIVKADEPERLLEWKQNNAEFDDVHYDVYQFPKPEVKKSLLCEQGFICAYTMLRVSSDSSHIEHIKPRTVSKNEIPPNYAETVEYQNLFACYPKTGVSGQPCCPFGAELRGSWWEPELFILPLDKTCEDRFRFLPDGSVEPTDTNDLAAQNTIERLGLDSPELKQLRVAAFDGEGILVTSENSITETEARGLSVAVMQRVEGKFGEFAIAIMQVAVDYANRLMAARKNSDL